jgi:hypothetical protein
MESSVAQPALRGKWAEGIEPRHFHWIVKDSLAICERPGGYGAQHRRVRRMEEIIWIRQQDFDWVASLIDSPHNLHNYDEQKMPYRHWPIAPGDAGTRSLGPHYTALDELLRSGKRVIVHHEELGDRVCGFVAGYLIWAGLIEVPPRAITAVEHITQRQLGPVGRGLVAAAERLAA